MQQQRFFEALENLQITLLETPDDGKRTIDRLVANKSRYEIMRVEALLFLYGKQYGSSLKSADALATEFSDQLSKYSDAVADREFAEECQAPKKVISYLVEKEARAKRKFHKYLESENWLSSKKNPINKIKADLAEVPWLEPEQDRTYVIEKLKADILKAQERQYDLSSIEEVHRARRHIRWILLQINASGGLFEGAESTSSNQITSEIYKGAEQSKYSTLGGVGKPTEPISLEMRTFLEAVDLVRLIGEGKDFEIGVDRLQEAFLESDLAKDEKSARIEAEQFAKNHSKYTEFRSGSANGIIQSQKAIAKLLQETLPQLRSEMNKNLQVSTQLKANVQAPQVSTGFDVLENIGADNSNARLLSQLEAEQTEIVRKLKLPKDLSTKIFRPQDKHSRSESETKERDRRVLELQRTTEAILEAAESKKISNLLEKDRLKLLDIVERSKNRR